MALFHAPDFIAILCFMRFWASALRTSSFVIVFRQCADGLCWCCMLWKMWAANASSLWFELPFLMTLQLPVWLCQSATSKCTWKVQHSVRPLLQRQWRAMGALNQWKGWGNAANDIVLFYSTILKLLLSDLCTYLLINFWPVADTSGDSADHVSLYACKLCWTGYMSQWCADCMRHWDNTQSVSCTWWAMCREMLLLDTHEWCCLWHCQVQLDQAW